jgi:hypothetical protein
MLWSGLLILIYDVEWSVSLCSRLVVSFCILLSDWFFFLASEWLIGRKWRLLIGQTSWLLIVWRWNTSQSFYHPIIKTKTAYSSRSPWVHSMFYAIFNFMCMFCKSLFVLCTFSFGHFVLFFINIRILITPLLIFKLFFTPGVWWGPCCPSI